MSSYYLNDFLIKVVFRKIPEKNIAKKWYEWYEGADYQQVI